LIALTGHTSGIGKEVFARLGADALGFSTSNGHDITSAQDRKKIIRSAQHCRVFINNASAGFGQTELLIELFQEWHDQSKLILNVGSRIAELTHTKGNLHLLPYLSQKKSLKSTVAEIQNYPCRVEYVWFGFVGTARILTKYPHFTENDYISVDAAADIIMKPILDYLDHDQGI